MGCWQCPVLWVVILQAGRRSTVHSVLTTLSRNHTTTAPTVFRAALVISLRFQAPISPLFRQDETIANIRTAASQPQHPLRYRIAGCTTLAAVNTRREGAQPRATRYASRAI